MILVYFVSQLVKRLTRSARFILAQDSLLLIVSNQILVEYTTKTTHSTEGNKDRVKIKARIRFEKLTT
jgi:hypothetical protein